MAQGLQLVASLNPTTAIATSTTDPKPYPLSLMFGEENVDTKSLHYTRPFSPAETMEAYPLISQGEFWRGTIPTKDLKKMCQQLDTAMKPPGLRCRKPDCIRPRWSWTKPLSLDALVSSLLSILSFCLFWRPVVECALWNHRCCTRHPPTPCRRNKSSPWWSHSAV